MFKNIKAGTCVKLICFYNGLLIEKTALVRRYYQNIYLLDCMHLTNKADIARWLWVSGSKNYARPFHYSPFKEAIRVHRLEEKEFAIDSEYLILSVEVLYCLTETDYLQAVIPTPRN